MRKSILRFGALALMSMMSIGVWAQGLKDGEFVAQSDLGTYYVLDESKAQVEFRKEGSATNGRIPMKVKNSANVEYTVIAIANEAFKQSSKNIYIPNTVTKIGQSAFFKATGQIYFYHKDGSSNVDTDVPCSYLTSIGYAAFQDVKFNKVDAEVVIKASDIGAYAFASSNLVKVKWANGTNSIKNSAFESCENLTDFVFAKGDDGEDYVSEIGSYAFKDCEKLKNFGWLRNTDSEYYLPSTLTTINNDAFYGCKALTGLKFIQTIPPAILTVSKSAFEGCSALTSDDFKVFGNATQISSRAFKGCTSLTSVSIPDAYFSNESDNEGTPQKPVYVYHGAFEGCTGLTTVTFIANNSRDLGTNMFNGCTALATLNKFNTLNIQKIPEGAFCGCVALTSVTFPKVKTIEKSAFAGTSLTNLNLPESLETIGEQAFANTSFASVTFPKNVTSIGSKAFFGNSAITSVTIIGKGANADTQTAAGLVECADDDVFGYVEDETTKFPNAQLTVPYGCYGDYTKQTKHKEGSEMVYDNLTWHKFTDVKNREAAYDVNNKFWSNGLQYTVTKNDGKGLAEVKVTDGNYIQGTFNSTKQNAADKAKENDQNQKYVYNTAITTSIVIPQYVVTLYDAAQSTDAWYVVTGLDNVNTAPLTKTVNSETVPTDEANAIAIVTDVTIKAADIAVPACFNAGAGFTGLTTFKTEGGSIKSLASKAFYMSSNLETVEINTTKEFTTLDTEVFSQCKSLAKFDIPSTVKYIYSNAFLNTALDKVTLPDGLTHINAKAFYNTKLISINIPSSVTNIGANAFSFNHDNKTSVETGVKDVYVNWETTLPAGIDLKAFGDVMSETKGGTSTTVYYLRNLHYPAGQAGLYKSETAGVFAPSANIFNGLQGIKVNGENLYTEVVDGVESITLKDNVKNVVVKDWLTGLDVTYERDFVSSNYQCWFVPFDYEYTADSPATFAYLFDTKIVDNETQFEYKEVPVGEKILANVPYLVKPKQANLSEKNPARVNFKASELQPTSVANGISVSNVETIYNIEGTYDTKWGQSPATWFALIADGGYFQLMGKDDYIHAYRFFITSDDNVDPYHPVSNIKLVVLDDEDATGIMDINAQSLNAPMFDLMGRQIVAPAKGQVYIQNGVKKLAK